MDNKKYLDKVIEHLVRSTKIDYEKELLSPPFYPTQLSFFLFPFSPSSPSTYFSSYCKNTFGLTEDEISYVWNEFKEIILDKVENGE